ncbi:MAG TPA: maleylpyruvate isomerase family mycothiol-dependent enzyme [Acidimicrobiales bacterium]|nr:maleylpyruvate isomerase family mycothiol-dependent enzyme [Acidimicrobiales bacterium]
MSDRLEPLGASVARLNDVVAALEPSDYISRAYPSEWSIADTCSHLGSGAVISRRRFEDWAAQRETDPSFNSSVWDEWNAKDPSDQVAECLTNDAALLSLLQATTDEQRSAFQMAMGPFSFDFDGMVGLRLSEHALHTWDIEVVGDPGATLPTDAANVILDSVQFIVARTAKPTGEPQNVTIRTLDPPRDFTLILGADTAELVESPVEGPADLELPAESFVRLIYGRLDAEHTPAQVTGDVLDELRLVFPGF